MKIIEIFNPLYLRVREQLRLVLTRVLEGVAMAGCATRRDIVSYIFLIHLDIHIEKKNRINSIARAGKSITPSVKFVIK